MLNKKEPFVLSEHVEKAYDMHLYQESDVQEFIRRLKKQLQESFRIESTEDIINRLAGERLE